MILTDIWGCAKVPRAALEAFPPLGRADLDANDEFVKYYLSIPRCVALSISLLLARFIAGFPCFLLLLFSIFFLIISSTSVSSLSSVAKWAKLVVFFVFFFSFHLPLNVVVRVRDPDREFAQGKKRNTTLVRKVDVFFLNCSFSFSFRYVILST